MTPQPKSNSTQDMRTLYLVNCIEEERETQIGITVRLSDGEDLIGMCPVYRTRKGAEERAGNLYGITEITSPLHALL